jgi:hypothetical protein
MRARAADRHGEAQGCRALAKWAASRAEPDRALHYLALAERAAEVRGSPRERALNVLARAEVAVAAERWADAQALAETAAEAFEAMGMAWHLGCALRLAQVS